MRSLSIIALTAPGICAAQSKPAVINKADIAGYYFFVSITYEHPVDLNHDGRSSTDYAAETNACAVDVQYELYENGTGKYYTGQHEKDCTNKTITAIKWKQKDVMVKQVLKHYLVIGDADGFDATPYEIVAQRKNRLVLRGEFRDGTDSTSGALLELKKKKSVK